MLKVGLIGYGYWGPNLARNLADSDAVRLVAIADGRAERRAAAERRHPGVVACADASALFARPDIDALLIDPATNKVTLRIPGLEAAHGVTVSPDGTKAYFTVDADSTVKSYDMKSGKLLGSVKLHDFAPTSWALELDGKLPAKLLVALAP